jgi:uncharacterized protein YbjT (DUF2867 family)
MAHVGTVLITGATGRVGKVAISLLARSGRANIRACARNDAAAEHMKTLGANEVVKFDLKDSASWEAAVKGVDVVYSASTDPLIKEHMDFAKFLGTKKDQIKHVVRISCFGADTNTNSYVAEEHCSVEGQPIPMMLQHYWWSEECLIKEGLPVTSIRGNFYMNHLLKNETANIQDKGFFEQPLAETKNSYVCSNDIGEVAATCILEGPDKHAQKFYDITGPIPQSMHEVAADLSTAMGQKVEYRPQDLAQWEADFGATRAAFRAYLRNGFYTRCSPDFYNLTGRKPTTYLDYLTTKGPHGETGLEELFSASGKLYTKGVDPYKGLENVKKA